MNCYVAVFRLGLIAGSVRSVPLLWMLIDLSFGVVGIIPLMIVCRPIRRLESLDPKVAVPS